MRPRNPVRAPDQRYWRRRANRRVRKARRARSLLRWSLILVVNALLAAVLVYSGLRTLRYLKTSPEFAVQRIELNGGRRSSEQQIRDRLTPFLGHNLLDLDLRRLEAEVRRDPWVLRASLRRVLPATLQVTIHERTPSALAVIEQQAYVVDTTGYVIGAAGRGAADSLPVLTGLDGMDKTALRAALRRGASVLERLRRSSPAFTRAVSEIDLAHRDRIGVRLIDGVGRVLLDPEQVERNLANYLDLREEIERLSGPVAYADLRWRDRISVMPTSQGSVKEQW